MSNHSVWKEIRRSAWQGLAKFTKPFDWLGKHMIEPLVKLDITVSGIVARKHDLKNQSGGTQLSPPSPQINFCSAPFNVGP